ncbi:MAG: hypothetical protein EBZ54_02980 [Actinobacteria bacterium]|nr:hypothetical protein [Actinomycetota bacterium]
MHWDEIVSIESIGEQEVYDATVPGTHNFKNKEAPLEVAVVSQGKNIDFSTMYEAIKEYIYKPKETLSPRPLDPISKSLMGNYESNFACANSVVEPWFLNWRCYGRTLLCKWRRLLVVATCRTSRARATSLSARLRRALRKDPDALTLRVGRQANG